MYIHTCIDAYWLIAESTVHNSGCGLYHRPLPQLSTECSVDIGMRILHKIIIMAYDFSILSKYLFTHDCSRHDLEALVNHTHRKYRNRQRENDLHTECILKAYQIHDKKWNHRIQQIAGNVCWVKFSLSGLESVFSWSYFRCMP